VPETDMSRPRRFFASLLLLTGFAPPGAAAADMHPILQRLRTADCGIAPGAADRWRPNAQLDAAAARWARGEPLRGAVEGTGYVPTALGALHVDPGDSRERLHLDAASCGVLRNRALRDAGLYRRGSEHWIVFAAGAELPSSGDLSATLELALTRVNDARRQGHRCGHRNFPPANPLRLSAALSDVAGRHAEDMAIHHYLGHLDRSGHSPAARVRASGYRERLVGENVAFGPLSTADAISGWLASPAHCENLMDPRFKEMGIGFAQRRTAPQGIYWVQLLADPESHTR
jgi:uncharacterized protein YkwD